MITVSERYEAHDLDPLYGGWAVGVGRDTRLDRPVLLARYAAGGRDESAMSSWLTRRASVSHVHVAQLLDLYQGPNDFVCVFEGAADSRVGLPNLPRAALLSSCLQVVDGMESLTEAGIWVPFFGGQVMWDGQYPKLLGLPLASGQEASMLDLVKQLGSYFGSVLEWHLLSSSAGVREDLPTVWQAVIKRLLGQTGQTIEDIGELRVILQALQEIPDDESLVPLEEVYQDDAKREDRYRASALEDDDDLETDYEEDTYEDDFEDAQAVRGALLRRLLPLAIGVLSVAVMILMVGVIVSQLGLLSNRSAASGIPATSSQGAGQAAANLGGTSGKTGGGSAAGGQAATASHAAITHGVVGLSAQTALVRLLGAGIPQSAIHVISTASGGHPGDQVLSMAPASGAVWTPGETVALYVAVPSGETLVPDVLGMSTAQASQVLLAAHLHYAYQIMAHQGTPAGVVFSQSPQAYAVTTASKVTFQVAAHY